MFVVAIDDQPVTVEFAPAEVDERSFKRCAVYLADLIQDECDFLSPESG